MHDNILYFSQLKVSLLRFGQDKRHLTNSILKKFDLTSKGPVQEIRDESDAILDIKIYSGDVQKGMRKILMDILYTGHMHNECIKSD